MRSNITFHPNQWLHLRVQPIAHQFEFPVRRYKANGSIILESRKPHTLMKFDILHLDCFPPCRPPGRLKHDFIVQSKA